MVIEPKQPDVAISTVATSEESKDKQECQTCGTDHPNPVHRAAYVGHLECIKFIFRHLKDTSILLDTDNNSPLHACVAGGQVAVLKYLLQFTRIPIPFQNNHGETCVHTAALRHRLECLKVLLGGSFKKAQSFATIKDRLGCTALHYAVLVNDNDCALWLLQRFGKNLANMANEDDVLPLHVAAAQGNIEFIRTATKYDLNMVNKRDANGATPAFYSVQSGYLQCLKYLVEKAKADIQTLTNRGQSLLHAACLNGHLAVVQWLFTKMDKSAVYQQTNDAATTFHCAAFGGHEKILQFLHKVSGNRRFAVSSTDRRGNTALHLAALNGFLDCVQCLVQLGAEPRMKNLSGHTCVDMAEKRDHLEVVNCLLASVFGSKEVAKRKYVRHKSHSDNTTNQAERIRPNSLSTSGYSSGAAASDGYGRTALPLSSANYNEPSSGYASSSDKGTKESGALWESNEIINKTTNSGSSSTLLETNWLLRRKEGEENFREQENHNNTKAEHKNVKLKSCYSIFQPQPSIQLITPRALIKNSYGGGPILINREVQTDFDPLEENIIIVDEQERIIFSSVPTIPTIFTKNQNNSETLRSSIVNAQNSNMAAAAVGNFESESQKRAKKRRRKPSLRERRKSQQQTTPKTSDDFWISQAGHPISEMQERKRTNSNLSISSSSSSDNGCDKTIVVHVEKAVKPNDKKCMLLPGESSDIVNLKQKEGAIFAGIQAAEKIDEYLRNEPEAGTDTDDSIPSDFQVQNRKTLSSHVTTAVIHKSDDQQQFETSPKTLDRRLATGPVARPPLRRPSDVGVPLTLPVWHEPHKKSSAQNVISISNNKNHNVISENDIVVFEGDKTLDFKPLKLFSTSNENVANNKNAKHSVVVNKTQSIKRVDSGHLSQKSISVDNLHIVDENCTNEETLGRHAGFRMFGQSSVSLMDLCNAKSTVVDKKLTYAAEAEYGTLKPLPVINNKQNKDEFWRSASCNNDDNYFPPPPPPTDCSDNSCNTNVISNNSSGNRLFYKRSAAGAFKARDKLLSQHLHNNEEEQTKNNNNTLKTVVRQSVSEIRRQLEDKLISRGSSTSVSLSAPQNLHNQDNSQTSVCNENLFVPIKSTISSYQQSVEKEDQQKQQQAQPVTDKVIKVVQPNLRYFGTSNASDYALRGRINEIIKFGAASKDGVASDKQERRIYEVKELDEEIEPKRAEKILRV